MSKGCGDKTRNRLRGQACEGLTLEVQKHVCEGRDADQVVEDGAAVGIVGAVVVGLHRIEHLACLLGRGRD